MMFFRFSRRLNKNKDSTNTRCPLHVPEKDLKDKILNVNQIPSNMRKPQILDTYIKELLVENKKSSTMYQDKVLKSIQDKVMNIFGPFSKLWTIMEEEREASRDQKDSELDEISSLFEQSAWVIAQLFHSVGYYRRLNIFININWQFHKSQRGLRRSIRGNESTWKSQFIWGKHLRNA